jgi:hypothetical protein
VAQLKLFRQAVEGLRRFDGVEVFTLDVFDQGESRQRRSPAMSSNRSPFCRTTRG